MSRHSKPLAQQVIVITGASSGIGLATAIAAAREGAKVVLVARSGDTLQRIAEVLREDGHEVATFVADVAQRGDLQDVADEVALRHGRIDTWVNNAGISIYGRLEEVDDADSRRLFDVNFWGTVNGSLAALPYLRESEGTLINVGSELSEGAMPLQGMYTASKHAVKGFTDSLRIEVELVDKAPVEIALIQPTAVQTPYAEHARNYMDEEPQLPLEGIEPARVAAAILEAAVQGGRDVKVGATSHLNVAMGKIAPALADRLAARMSERQKKDEPARNPKGALYEPSESGRVRGEPRED